MGDEAEDRHHIKEEEIMEIRSLRRIISAYLNYSDAAEADVKRYESSFKKLSCSHKALLSHLPSKFQKLRRCISINGNFIINMIQAFDPPVDMSRDIDFDEECNSVSGKEQSTFVESYRMAGSSNNIDDHKEAIPSPNMCNDSSLSLNVPLVDVDKVRCIIRYVLRDWAIEGRNERDECYKPILEELQRLFLPPRCLVPGAGLCRLALEISCLGFLCQGNEFSYYMIICSSFILNHTQAAGEWTIYPWIHNNSNFLSDDDQLQPVMFPDIRPASAGITEGFSMCGGDFVEVYSDVSQEGTWDAVVTCFFIDTGHNVVDSPVSRGRQIWINFGPLLYDFADPNGPDEMPVELSLDDVKRISFHYGFDLEMERTVETTYSINRRSMMQNKYFAAFWTMRKRPSRYDPPPALEKVCPLIWPDEYMNTPSPPFGNHRLLHFTNIWSYFWIAHRSHISQRRLHPNKKLLP
ncbi:unnamed protein product [Spirodela intermedia]|uniref:Uncharacterized protein n=1 Tax=Spirodela intermedia TaxID=51605 RepID=A0A7I8JLB3_SPIIN|nr:unnamed protein product [Spirodela intermedia]CAA6670860.1 unnamed protein product [Spirodela intermedia]